MSTMGYVTTLTGAEDAANLSLDFEKQNYRVVEGGKLVSKQFSDLITFTRSTTGGRWNDKGIYETVGVNQPKFDYDPITKVLKGLLIEEQRTNQAPYSESCLVQTTRASYVSTGEVWIDESSQFKKLVEDTTNGTHFGLPSSVVVQPDTTYTFSYFVKAAGRTKVQFQMQNSASWAGTAPLVELDLAAKTITGTSLVTSMQEVGNGVFRIFVTATTKGAATGTVAFSSTCYPVLKDATGNITYTGDGVSGVYIGGYQVEAGTFATTYIPTPANFVSRASTATYFDKNGVLKTAAVNVARTGAYDFFGTTLKPVGLLLETASTNRVKEPHDFSLSRWVKPSSTMTISKGSVAPDGSLSSRITLISALGHNLNQTLDTVLLVGTTYTLSLWVKAVKGSFPFQLGYYDLSANLNATNITPTGEWVRYSYTFTPTVLANSPQVRLIGFQQGLDGDQVDIWGAQLEVGSSASSFIYSNPTFTSRASTASYIDSAGIIQTAAVNVARDQAYGYDSSGVLRPIGLLLEGSATNLLSYSDNYVTGTSGTWGNSGPGTLPLIVTPNAANGTRGEGTMTLMARQDLGIKYLFKAFTAGAGTVITRTQRIKAVDASPAGTCLTMRLQTESYANRVDAWFNVTTGVCAAQGIGDCEVIGVSMVKERDGVWLCTLTGKSGVGAWGSVAMSALDRAGTTDSTPASVCSLYIDTAQCEIGSSATSYIPTTTTTVTRAADVYSSTTATRASDISTSVATTRTFDSASVLDITPWYNNLEGTADVSFTPGPAGVGGTTVAYYFRSPTDAAKDVVVSRRNASGEVISVVTDRDGINQAILTGLVGTSPNTRFHCALALKKDNFAFDVNGRLGPALDTIGTLPLPSRLYFGNGGNNSQNANGYIHKFSYYPVRLSNNQIETLTS